MKRIYFGTDGIRGPFGGPLINPHFAARLGVAVARFFKKQGTTLRAVIGRDTRDSGVVLEDAVARGLVAEGADVVLAGILPTPALAAGMDQAGATIGVMITASHNPAGDNGIKFFGAGGFKLSDSTEAEIEGLLPPESWTAPPIGALPAINLGERYCRYAQGLLPPRALQNWPIVLDTANGASCQTSLPVFQALGAKVTCIGNAPDGTNINAGTGSEHPAVLAEKVVSSGARIGIAHDGDGDRCVLCDEQGNVLDGDELLTLLAVDSLEQRTLANNTLVITVQSNLGVDAAVTARGGQVVRTSVGDRYVLEGMRQSGASLGGESSGHIICLDSSTTGDGLVAAIKVLQVMVRTGKPLSELRKVLQKFPQVTSTLKVREKKELGSLENLNLAIARLENQLGHSGRVLVRYSGTEPKLRFLVEGPTDTLVQEGMQTLLAAAQADLEVG